MAYLAEVIPAQKVEERNFFKTGPGIPSKLLKRIEEDPTDIRLELWFSSSNDKRNYSKWKLYRGSRILHTKTVYFDLNLPLVERVRLHFA